MQDFDQVLKESREGVFRNENALSPHYVPEVLLDRDREISELMRCVAPALENRKPKNLFIYGKSGTGKTACTKKVAEKLSEKGKNVLCAYMNCRIYDSRYKALQKCISEFKPDFARTGYSFSVLYEKLLDWIEGSDGEEAKQLIVILDEVDMVKDLDSLIYTLTRSNDDLRKGSISMIGISNNLNFTQRIDPRSKSSLCEEQLVFPPYNAEQLQEILLQRSKEAFNDGVVEKSAINLAGAVAAGENGDARYALSLLLRAGELAQSKKLKKISDLEVEESRKKADEDKANEVISSLPIHQQLILYAIASLQGDLAYKRLIEDNGEKLYFSGEVYERYSLLCKKAGQEPRTSRWYREYINDLELLGLITTTGSGKGMRGHTTLIHLSYDSSRIKKILDKTLFGEEKKE